MEADAHGCLPRVSGVGPWMFPATLDWGGDTEEGPARIACGPSRAKAFREG